MVRVKRGDILRADETIIAHQVNCFGDTGGLAYHVFLKWPDAGADYYSLVNRFASIGRRADLLGMAHLSGQQNDGKIIASLYGQYFPGRDFRPEMLKMALTALARAAKGLGASVALPYKISCGICGGDWMVVRRMIEDTMDGVDVTIYRLD